MGEFILLSREWKKDKKIIAKAVQNLQEFSDPISLLLCAEGTRRNDNKLRASQDYCVQNGLPVLKHHLMPRHKGFVESIKNLDTSKIK